MSYWHKIAYKNPFCFKFWERKYLLWKEKREGVDFSIMVDPEEVGLSHANVRRSCPTAKRWLHRVLRKLSIKPDDTIIDMGCGKGAAMRHLLDFPFARVDGVEISDAIASVARRNFCTLGIAAERFRIFTSDATQFTDLDSYTYIYFYNPFPSLVMSKCMENIFESLKRRPRRLTIIYNHPSCHAEVTVNGVFSKVGEYPSEWGNKIFLYRNRD